MNTVLSMLQPGESCTVLKVGVSGALGRRLRDFGLISGTKVVCCYQSPDTSVAAYEVRGSVLALRRKDLTLIRVHRNG